MKLLIERAFKIVLCAAILFAATAAHAQNARLQLDKLERLETRAQDVVEVNIDGKLLDLAKRTLTKVNDRDARKIAQAISGLQGIYVRVFNFANENEYNAGEIDEIRQQLNQPGWERLANVRSKRNNQKVDVFTSFTGNLMSGVAVVVSESKSVAVVNIIGAIDIELLAELGGKLNIPKMDIETDANPNQKP